MRVIYPLDEMIPINPSQTAIIEHFLGDMERVPGVTIEKISFARLWEEDPPIEAGGQSLKEWLIDVTSSQSFIRSAHSNNS